jgi:hypothetical protein
MVPPPMSLPEMFYRLGGNECHGSRISVDYIRTHSQSGASLCWAGFLACAESIDSPTAFTHKLDLILGMPVRTRSRTGVPVKPEHRYRPALLQESHAN